jgi:CRP-like cAMP-binding protein
MRVRNVSGGRFLRQIEGTSDDRARRLRRCPLFQHLGLARLRAVLRQARTRRVGKGGYYFREGERAGEAYVLMRGRVILVRIGPRARRDILRFVAPPEPFGHEAALGGARFAASAQASENSEALAWRAPVLARLMVSDPVIVRNGLRLMAERIQGTWKRLHALLTEPLERRTARALLVLASRTGRAVDGSAAIELRLARQDLAAFVGATPYAVSRLVSRWRRRRIVDAGRGWVVVRPRRLAAIAANRGLPRDRR